MNIPSPPTVATLLMQAPLMGSFVALWIYGITCIQTLYYFQTYPDDHLLIKFMVAMLWVFETIHSGLNMSFMNRYLIINFGNILALNTITWDLLASFECGFISGFIVNTFFTLRTWRFTRNIWATSFLMLFTVARFAISTVVVAYGVVYGDSWITFRDHSHPLMLTVMTLGMVSDTFSAFILARYLHEGRTGIRRTDRLINRLLIYVIANGGSTALIALVTLISVLASPNSGLFLAFVIVLMKVYANSALLTLNVRQIQRTALSNNAPVNISLSGYRNTGQVGDAMIKSQGSSSQAV